MGRHGRYFYTQILPFGAMVFLQCTQVGLTTVFKAATDKGMSYRVFIVYSYALSGIVLLPFAYFFDRNKKLPPLKFSSLGRLFLLGLLGYSAQMFGYKGIEYSNPTLASAMSNLSPAFTFALAILFRMEKVQVRSMSSQAKIIGAIVSIAGALVAVLYEGPTVVRSALLSPNLLLKIFIKSSSGQSDWILGGFLLAADYLVLSTWYIAQAQTVRKYPAELFVVSLYNLAVAFIAAPVTFFLEKNYAAWRIDTRIALIAILYAGLYGSSFATVILTWGLRLKGPVYVSLFQPLSIVIAAFMSVIFLGDSLYLGSVIGAIIISVGFYVVMWGKAKEETVDDNGVGSLESPSTETTTTTPLLQ